MCLTNTSLGPSVQSFKAGGPQDWGVPFACFGNRGSPCVRVLTGLLSNRHPLSLRPQNKSKGKRTEECLGGFFKLWDFHSTY